MQQQIQITLELLKNILGRDLVGAYLFGSALIGGLQNQSDIDLLVVTNRQTTEDEKTQIVEKLLQISGNDQRPIELTLLEKSAVNPWNYPPCVDFQYGEWLRPSFESGRMPDLAITITQVLLKSQTLYGKEPAELLAPVPFTDFRKAMLEGVEQLVADLESDTRNVLLTLARIWYTVETDCICSKSKAADWAPLPKEFQGVMERAKSIYLGEQEESWEDLQKLIQPCAEYMAEKIKACPLSSDPQKSIKLSQ